jgi:hypothetical protein
VSRREALEREGLAALGSGATKKDLVRAFAAMLDLAVRTSRPAKAKKEAAPSEPMPYGPKEVFDGFDRHCGHIIQLRPYDASTFGRLGQLMKRIKGLELDDCDRVVAWVQSGGLSTWPNQVTWTHVVRHYANWVAYARAWAEKGGAALSRGADEWR